MEILIHTDYFEVNLFLEGEKWKTDYAHRSCWDKRNNVNDNTMDMIKQALTKAKDLGIIKPMEVNL